MEAREAREAREAWALGVVARTMALSRGGSRDSIEYHMENLLLNPRRWAVEVSGNGDLNPGISIASHVRQISTALHQLQTKSAPMIQTCEWAENLAERGWENLQQIEDALIILRELHPDSERALQSDDDITRLFTWSAHLVEIDELRQRLAQLQADLSEFCHRSSEYRRRFAENWQSAYDQASGARPRRTSRRPLRYVPY